VSGARVDHMLGHAVVDIDLNIAHEKHFCITVCRVEDGNEADLCIVGGKHPYLVGQRCRHFTAMYTLQEEVGSSRKDKRTCLVL
jgi:hypothetical protein